MTSILTATQSGDYLAVRVCMPVGENNNQHNNQNNKPLSLAFLLDVSDSMNGERLDSVKRTLSAARDLFQPSDRVTLVTFGEKATTVANAQIMDEAGLVSFYDAVAAINTDGCTNLSAGLEELALIPSTSSANAIVLLTDGQINRGVTTSVGLRMMALGVAGAAPLYTLGYGSDHNRTLLRELATKSHGSYTFVDSEEILPAAMGDLMGGLRSEVLRGAVIHTSEEWVSQELGGACLGSLVPGRDYWVVFKKKVSSGEIQTSIRLTGQDQSEGSEFQAETTEVSTEPSLEVDEQIFRCRIARLLAETSDALESHQSSKPVKDKLVAISAELDGLSPAALARPLTLRMRAQIAEALDAISRMSTHGLTVHTPPSMLSRLSAGAAILSTQRGATDPMDQSMFSSPLQRTTSNGLRARFTNTPSSPPRVRRMNAVSTLTDDDEPNEN